MTYQITLPTANGALVNYTLSESRAFPTTCVPPRSRKAYAAAHIVSRQDARAEQPVAEQIDWEATLAYREYLWSLGFSVAEAMDTAQRGMGLDWEAARELIHRSMSAVSRADVRDRIACGAGTDHLTISTKTTLENIITAYEGRPNHLGCYGYRRPISPAVVWGYAVSHHFQGKRALMPSRDITDRSLTLGSRSARSR
jgi:hypothetical protein